VLTVSVLGPVEIRRDGELVAVPAGKSTEVLVRLALDAGVPVRTERLIEDLWADATGTAKNTLQSKISQLRRALGAPGALVSRNGGYLLDVPPDAVDARRVEGLAAAASARRRAGDPTGAVTAASDGLALFRGDVLVDAGDGEWLRAPRARLEEVRLGLLEDQLAARVDLGAGGDVIGALEDLVHQHPLREGLWASLITALYRAGRQADALAAYTRVREALIDELGIEPGPELRLLEAQVLQQSASLTVPPSDGRAAGGGSPALERGTPGRTSNLPALTSDLIGRDREVADLQDLLDRRRLVTVVGPAGVGKTRAAIEVARAASAGVATWLVRLDAADAGTSIPQMVAEVLQLAGGEAMLLERVATTEMLIVLDNCEHVIDAVADLVGRLLDASTQLRVLATSQRPLGLDGEAVFALEPLSAADSVALFAARAEEMRSRFVLDADTAPAVAEVCDALDGLPLAIELAAARVKSLSVREIARRLDDRFALLQDPTSRRPERRRGLASAIAWSYDLLFPDDQRGLWALACFAGGAPLAAAEHVLGALGVPPASAVDVVGRLVDRSLVSVEVTEGDEVRYRLLDSIRAFAGDRLLDSGSDPDGRAAHAHWYAAEGDRCAVSVRGSGQSGCVAFVRAERTNIDAALRWAAVHDPALGLRLANGFAWTWVVLGDGAAGAMRVRRALDAAAATAAPGERAQALLAASWLEASAGDLGRAEQELDEVAAIADEIADARLRADAQRHLAFLRIQQGRPHDVLELTDACLGFVRPAGLDWERAGALLLRAFASMILGETERATVDAEDAALLMRLAGDDWGLVHGEAMLGAIAQAEGRFEEAAASLAEAASSAEQLGFLGQAALHLTTLGRVQQQAGREEIAAETLERAIVAATNSGDLRMAATARLHLARIMRTTGREERARDLLQQSDDWYAASGGGDGALLTQCLLAAVRTSLGEPGAAGDLAPLLDVARAADDLAAEAVILDALARRARVEGAADDADALLATADAVAEQIPHLLVDADRVDARLARLAAQP
jgi:predicted ATPase/DNA-binding SARP family transcriptional activator